MLVDSEQVSIEEALKKKVWLKSMKEELKDIEKRRLGVRLSIQRQENHKRYMGFQGETEAKWIN